MSLVVMARLMCVALVKTLWIILEVMIRSIDEGDDDDDDCDDDDVGDDCDDDDDDDDDESERAAGGVSSPSDREAIKCV